MRNRRAIVPECELDPKILRLIEQAFDGIVPEETKPDRESNVVLPACSFAAPGEGASSLQGQYRC